MFERFTQGAIKTIMLAQEESRRRGHNYVGTEQILLGLIGEGSGIAHKVLKSEGVNLKTTRLEVEKIIGRGAGFVAIEIPFTARAKQLLENSWAQAKLFGINYIGTEHLLLGLLQGDGVGVTVLKHMGCSKSTLEKAVLAALGQQKKIPTDGAKELQKHRDIHDETLSQIDTRMFTIPAMAVIALAREECRKTRQADVGTEHLLLGILSCAGDAAKVLHDAGITYQKASEKVKTLFANAYPVPLHIPFSLRAAKVIIEAWNSTRTYDQRLLNTEQLLLTLIQECPDSNAMMILTSLSADFNALKAKLLEHLENPSDEPGMASESEPTPDDDANELKDKISYWQLQAKRGKQLEEDARDAEQRCREALAKLKPSSDEMPPG